MNDAEFVMVATTDEIPAGERIVAEVRGKWVAVFNVGGQYYAIEDVCTHDGNELADGELDGYEIICSRHQARFDVRSGQVMRPPAFSDVPWYEVRVTDNQVLVGQRKKG